MFDPFLERVATPFRARYHLLGSDFSLESNDRKLMRLAAHAFAGLPTRQFPGPSRRLKIRLLLQGAKANPGRPAGRLAPEVRLYGWDNVFCATMGPDTIAVVSPDAGSGLIVVSEQALAHPYNLRYELIEFAVFMLATRSRDLVPLHGACIALNGHGLLLLGDRGAGKSVTSLACVVDGFEFIAEDGLVVHPDTLLTSGLSSFLHLRMDSLQFFKELKHVRSMQKSPTIARRSGVTKLEIDMRKLGARLARSNVQIRAIAFLSDKKTSQTGLVRPLARAVSRNQLEKTQPQASSLPQWREFSRRISRVPAYAVARSDNPKDMVAALRKILICQ